MGKTKGNISCEEELHDGLQHILMEDPHIDAAFPARVWQEQARKVLLRKCRGKLLELI